MYAVAQKERLPQHTVKQQTDRSRWEPRRPGVRDRSSKISLMCSAWEEVSQSRHKHDTAPHSETRSLNTRHVVSLSGIASPISGVVAACESVQMNADFHTRRCVWWDWLSSSLTGNVGPDSSIHFERHTALVL